MLLLSANWPQRARLRPQPRLDTRQDVVALDTAADVLAGWSGRRSTLWLSTARPGT